MSDDEQTTPSESGAETPLCANCFEEYLEGERYCPFCGAPLGEMPPWIDAQGWVYRKAAYSHVGTFIFLGAWLLLAPQIVGFTALAAIERERGAVVYGMLVISILYALLLYRITRNYFRRIGDSGPADEA